jgi:hypothetical protein
MSRRFHISWLAILFFSFALWGVGASFARPPEWPECVTSGLIQGVIGTRIVDGQRYFVRRMATIFDNALDDFGASGVGDQLEIFCVSRTASDKFGEVAMCLSNESCPWRHDDSSQ